MQLIAAALMVMTITLCPLGAHDRAALGLDTRDTTKSAVTASAARRVLPMGCVGENGPYLIAIPRFRPGEWPSGFA
jgi:hypothetical protein